MSAKHILSLIVKIVLLIIIFLVIYIGAAGIFLPELTNLPADPGLIPPPYDILVFGAANVLVLVWVIHRSQWHGWRLALGVGVAYYGLVTFMAQIETWWFLSSLTVSPEILRGLFLAGLPVPILFIPLAVWLLGRWKTPEGAQPVASGTRIPPAQWAWKLVVIALVYVFLYFAAGYFIAWQNPAVRAFYGGTDPGNFFSMMGVNYQQNPALFPFQFLRGLLWAMFALPVIRMGCGRPWETALLVAVFISVPMNIGHMMPNPFIPDASVRLSHMIETISSNFVFGLFVSWLLYRRHTSLPDLFGLR